MYFDTHAHFDGAEDEASVHATLGRARAAGVTRIAAVGASPSLNSGALRAGAAAPDEVVVALGWDRDQAASVAGADDVAAAVESLARMIDDAVRRGLRVVAVGEIGLDYHYSPATATAQVALLRGQLAFAARRGLPVILHSRDADDATLAELESHVRRWKGPADGVGVLHCFTGGEAFAKRLVDLGCLVSFSGILTFRNAEPLRAVARGIPDERLLIETDSPYLAPVPYRGARNEPAFLPAVAMRLAEVRGCDPAGLAALTTRNAERLFGLAQPG
jgi:TatD DNase family protein